MNGVVRKNHEDSEPLLYAEEAVTEGDRHPNAATLAAARAGSPIRLLQQMLAEQGVTDFHGIELMRRVRMVNNAYDAVLGEKLRTSPVTPSQWRVLSHIWTADALGQSGVQPTWLSRVLTLSKNTISDHLRSLEELGLIERALSTADRRQFHIRLTEAGTEMVRRLSPDHANALNQLADGLDAAEVGQLTHLLDKLCASIMRAGNVALPCSSHPTNHTESGEHPL